MNVPPPPTLTDPATGAGLRPMRDEEADYEVLSRWLSDERVLEWVYGRDDAFSIERTRKEFGPLVRGEDLTRACMITFEGRTVGYLQFTDTQAGDYGDADPKGAWGIDLWIGEPEYWERGIGPAVLRLIIDDLFEAEDAQRIYIDPRVENPRATHVYEKVGFRKVTVLREHELHEGVRWDNWLMEITREDWIAGRK